MKGGNSTTCLARTHPSLENRILTLIIKNFQYRLLTDIKTIDIKSLNINISCFLKPMLSKLHNIKFPHKKITKKIKYLEVHIGFFMKTDVVTKKQHRFSKNPMLSVKPMLFLTDNISFHQRLIPKTIPRLPHMHDSR